MSLIANVGDWRFAKKRVHPPGWTQSLHRNPATLIRSLEAREAMAVGEVAQQAESFARLDRMPVRPPVCPRVLRVGRGGLVGREGDGSARYSSAGGAGA